MPGYCDPPAEYRYKEGQSGNPKGGPKGPRRAKPQRRVMFLDQVIRCTIGGKRFHGTRREALMQVATKQSIIKKDFRLQQLLLKLKAQIDESQSHIVRDETFFIIADFPSSPTYVSCIEDAADVAGFGKKAYHKQQTARVLLESRVIEEALANLGERRLTREQQEEVLAAARFPKKVSWPEWWAPDLRERRKGWRAKQKIVVKQPPAPPQVVRVSLRDHLRRKYEEGFRRSKLEMERTFREDWT
jgi:hypothetical protein